MTRDLFNALARRARLAAQWIAIGLAAAMLAGCEAHIEAHGHIVDRADIERIKPGVATRASIQQILGQPSFEGAFDSGRIYYLGDIMIQPAGGAKRTSSRTLLVLTLDSDDILREIEVRDESTGRQIAYLDEKSPTPGEKLTGIEQIFANLRVAAR